MKITIEIKEDKTTTEVYLHEGCHHTSSHSTTYSDHVFFGEMLKMALGNDHDRLSRDVEDIVKRTLKAVGK